MLSDQYGYLFGGLCFLGLWMVYFIQRRDHRGLMVKASVIGAPFGLTEYYFVPAYWAPPTLFGLAENYRVDIESLIYCFSCFGLIASIYKQISPLGQVPDVSERSLRRFDSYAGRVYALQFPVLFLGPLVFPQDAIRLYLAAFLFAVSILFFIRPDQIRTMIHVLAIFLVFYLAIFLLMHQLWPDYFNRYWNQSGLSGVRVWFLPVEEVLWAITMCWNVCWGLVLYDWHRTKKVFGLFQADKA